MSFNLIRGQHAALGRLADYLRSGQALAGAYLFSGPEGVGKYTAARIFAKAANCRQAEADSCDSCPSCQKIDRNSHPDVHCIDCGSDEIKVEEIRQLQQDIGLVAYEAATKFFIINNAHNLNTVSANAFLKTLEEPGRHSAIVLITDKPQLLLPTIVSRCRQVKFAPLAREDVAAILREERGLDSRQSHFLAYFCEGRLGASLRLAESGDIFQEKNRVIDALLSPQPAELERFVGADREKMRFALGIAASWYRDLALLGAGGAEGLELINADRRQQLDGMAGACGPEAAAQGMRVVADSLRYLDQSVNLKLLLSHIKEHIHG